MRRITLFYETQLKKIQSGFWIMQLDFVMKLMTHHLFTQSSDMLLIVTTTRIQWMTATWLIWFVEFLFICTILLQWSVCNNSISFRLNEIVWLAYAVTKSNHQLLLYWFGEIAELLFYHAISLRDPSTWFLHPSVWIPLQSFTHKLCMKFGQTRP